jgi:cell division protein FtsW|tara:strand:- start:728 stop:1846 length:1119 start_codon:yes stop_codon:yes gene_type:complete
MINKLNIYDNYYSWWKNIDKTILILIISFFIAGLFFSLVSTSLIASDRLNTNSYFFFIKHFAFILLGFVVMFIFSLIKEDYLIKLSIGLFILSFLLLLLVHFIGVEVKGSRRWLDLPFLPRFQPVELIKPFYIVILSSLLNHQKYNLYFKYLLTLFLMAPIILLLISQPDIGQSILIIFAWLALVFVSGINLIIFFGLFGVFILLLSYLVFFVEKFNYIKIRISSFFDSSSNNNFQSEKASEAIIDGGFFGKGIGEGSLNSKIPEAHTDYIVSVISEEFGIVIILLIMLSLIFFAYNIFKKIRDTNDNLFKMILIGLISLLMMQAFVHVGVNLRVLPTTGMTLPYLSYGGSSIISISIISGIILNLTKRRVY